MLGKESLPFLSEMFSIIKLKEYRRNMILDEPSNKGSNLVIVKSPSTLIVVNQ